MPPGVYLAAVSTFDEELKRGQSERLDRAAERSVARRDRGPAPGPSGGLNDPAPQVVLHLAAAGVLAGAGTVLGLTFAPLVGGLLAGVGVVVGIRGLFRAFGGRTGAALPRPTRGDPRLLAAFDRATEALDGSPGLDEEQKLELGAALRAGLDEAQRLENERPRLLEAFNSLPDAGAEDARARLEQALASLDQRRTAFLDHCGRLQATLATMALGTDRSAALHELADLTSELGAQAEADQEIRQALGVKPRAPERA